MSRICNVDNVSKEYIDDPDFQTQLKTVSIGDAVGSEKIYMNIDFVKPGAKSTKYHSHSQQEEIFLIMSGSGVLRLNGEETEIKAGDVVSKPAGKDIAHQFINNGSEILQILDMGTREKSDIITYPDENAVYLKNSKLTFHMDDNIKQWTSDPNI
jgi:uncharacterized cupin superfamily protein